MFRFAAVFQVFFLMGHFHESRHSTPQSPFLSLAISSRPHPNAFPYSPPFELVQEAGVWPGGMLVSAGQLSGFSMSTKWITVAGAREHNLKNITVKIPRNALTVITGLSGSGKSSLAFDTIYAEGQRKYVESLSAYARHFLEQLQKPQVDYIEGLSPAISIEQRTAGSNPRSIVATTTEIFDYMRLLYASIGHPHCPQCGKPITQQSAESIVDQILAWPERTRIVVAAPLVRGRKGRHEDVLAGIRRRGFVRARVDGRVYELDDVPSLAKTRAHTIEVVVDRLVVGTDIRSRLTDSIELALKEGEGTVIVLRPDDEKVSETVFSEKNACADCGISFEALLPRSFSFNSPYGACPTCHGLGSMMVFDEDLIVPDLDKSLGSGAIRPWRGSGRRATMYYNRLLKALAAAHGVDMDAPYRDLPKDFRKILMYGTGEREVTMKFWFRGATRTFRKAFEGVIPNLERRYRDTKSEYIRKHLGAFMGKRHCTACDGARLRPEVLACTISGRSITDVCRLSVKDALKLFTTLELTEQEARIASELIKEIRERLGFMQNVGLDYLTLDRESGTLSGGEAQRIRLATQIGAGLMGVLYVLDEPSIGLHARDNERLIQTMIKLRDVGNTVIVVEHDEQTIRSADYVVDLGPQAGRHGGEVVFAGPVNRLLKDTRSLTARYLRREMDSKIPAKRTPPHKGCLEIVGARENNLKNIHVKIPLGLLVCITGVSGSGKSTLIDDILHRALFRHFFGSGDRPGAHDRLKGVEALDKVIVIDQSPIGRTPRSNPATYTGAFGQIRDLFAQLPASKVRGYKPGRYSFNVKGGRCEKCKGDGIIRIEMHFLPDVYVTCEQCRGRRYNQETLEVRYNGKSIADVLDMTISEAREFFQNLPAIERKLRTLDEVGLGYLQLGQPATTLSGGEAQRVKLSAELSRKQTGRTLYILDEPTTGLHFADVDRLMDVLVRLREGGNTLVVIEHNLDVIKMADYIIDLGPEGGDAGGRIVAEGTPEVLAACDESYTGRSLKSVLNRV